MRRTRRFWGEASLVVVLALLAAATARPVLLLGASGVASFLLVRQYVFVRSLARTLDGIDVVYEVSHPVTTVGEPVSVTIQVMLPPPNGCDLTIEVVPPPTAELVDGDPRLTMEAGELVTTHTLSVQWPVAGTFSFDRTRISAADPHGLVHETVEGEPGPQIRVDNRAPTPRRSNPAGSTEAPGAASHPVDRAEASGQRHPQPGAYATSVDRTIVVVVDHGSSLATGPAGGTALDHLRTAALGVVARARERNDLVGLVTVDESGPSAMLPPRGTTEGYASIRRRLLGLEPAVGRGTGAPGTNPVSRSPGWAARRAAVLEDDDSPFGRALRPYFEATSTHGSDDDRPLFEGLQEALRRFDAVSWIVILTDDGRRADLRRAVELAAARGADVSVFLAPPVRFDADDGGGFSTPQDRYEDFERFRREIDARPGVSAVEIGSNASP